VTTWLVVYDISDDDVRDHVARHLEARGTRVQESVFECGLDPDGVPRLAGELQALLGAPENGNMRMYRVCEACLAVSLLVGPPGEDSRPAYLIV
jgi:CRISPR-associated protein Cas2